MMHQGCRCPHHKVAFVVSWFVGFTALGFFLTMFRDAMFLGYGMDQYYMSVVVLTLLIVSMKACRCCSGHGMGWKCQDCGPMKMDQSMDQKSL